MEAAGGVDVEVGDATRFGGGAGVIEDGGGVGTLAGLDDFDAGAGGPDFELLDGGGAEGVCGAEQDCAVPGAGPGGDLAGGSGFAGAVDADEEGHTGRLSGIDDGFLRCFQDGADLGFEERAELFAAFDGAAFGAVAEGVEDFGGGL